MKKSNCTHWDFYIVGILRGECPDILSGTGYDANGN